MLKVIVDSTQSTGVRVREGEKNGRKWRMASQKVWIFKGGAPFPEQFEISLPDGAFAYPAGEYQLDFEALLVRGQYDSMALDTRNGVLLVPVQAAESVAVQLEAKTGQSPDTPLFKSRHAVG